MQSSQRERSVSSQKLIVDNYKAKSIGTVRLLYTLYVRQHIYSNTYSALTPFHQKVNQILTESQGNEYEPDQNHVL